MNAATLRNMTLDELTQYVDQCDSVPRDVVLTIMRSFQDDIDSADNAREEINDTLNRASAEIKDMIDTPLESADLYHKALKVWIEDWCE